MPSRTDRTVTFQQFVCGSAAMGTGAALIVTILFGVPLWATLLLFITYGVAVSRLVWLRASINRRSYIRQCLQIGIVAGLAATLAYDLVRWVLVQFATMDYWPFETFLLFGRSIGGAHLSREHAYVIGTLYHVANGVLFATAYAFLLGARHWTVGIAFSLALELVVLRLYPTWLNLGSVMAEFTLVSITGHVVYGAVLGVICSRGLRNRSRMASAS